MNRERLIILLKAVFWTIVLVTIVYEDITIEMKISSDAHEKAALLEAKR